MKQGIFDRVRSYIKKYHMIAPGDTVVAGVSGGADSVCLFLMLAELTEEMDFGLAVVHVNHGIRAEAGHDAEFVRRLCEEKKIPFELVKEDVREYARREKLSEEEAGRQVRYRAFEETLKKYKYTGNAAAGGKIAVAHNANDRAETMLFHLFRGTGLAGVGGIRPVRDNIIRPVLCLQREEIEEYLREKQISFCIDYTNLEDTYTRNRIRNHILYYVENEVCRGAVGHMCETADILLETESYILDQTKKAYDTCVTEESKDRIVLDVNRIKEEVPFIRRQTVLRTLEMLTRKRKDITFLHIRAIEELLDKDGTKQTRLPFGLTVRKEYDRLIFVKRDETEVSEEERETLPEIALPEEPEEGIGYEIEVPGLGIVEIKKYAKGKAGNDTDNPCNFFEKCKYIPEKSCTKWFDCDKITKSLVFRTRETGDYLTINKNMSRKTLKDYMIGEKIPKYRRGSIYILAEGSHILWVPGYRISEYYKVTEETKNILQVQLRGGL